MITLRDIKLSINKIIKTFPETTLVSESTIEDLPKPCFKVKFGDYDGSLYGPDNIEQSLIVRIYYFPSDKNDSEEVMDMSEQMLLKFMQPIKVTDTFIVHAKDYVSRVVDGVLQVSFELEFIQELDQEDTHEYMESIEIKL